MWKISRYSNSALLSSIRVFHFFRLSSSVWRLTDEVVIGRVAREELSSDPAGRELELEQEVTALELFFDLMFVFAITEVTSFLTHNPTWRGMLEAVAILMVL